MLEIVFGMVAFLYIIIGGVIATNGAFKLLRGNKKYWWSIIMLASIIGFLVGCSAQQNKKAELDIALEATQQEQCQEDIYSLGLYHGQIQTIENAELVEVGDDYYIISFFGEKHYYTK